jgi:DNA-binding beta-propeller fold protein YncE
VNHWTALTRFVEDGRLSPDNNLCESQLRDIALGRRNYLFSGSGIACDGHALWVVNSGEQSVTRLDPVGGAVLRVYKVGRCPLGATIAAGRLRVANSCSDSVSGVPLPLQFQ